MGIFRKPAPQLISGVETLSSGVEHNEHNFMPQLETVAITEVIDETKLQKFAANYQRSWENVNATIYRLNFREVLGSHGEKGSFELEDGSGRIVRKRKISQEDQDSILMTVLSARIAASDVDSRIYSPYLLNFDVDEYNAEIEEERTSREIFTSMRIEAEYLQRDFTRIEQAVELVTKPLEKYIQQGDLDEFISWVRGSSTNADLGRVMEIIAQDVHDPSRGKILDAIKDRITSSNGQEVKAKFADALDHSDGEYLEEVSILNFALTALSQRRIDSNIHDIVTTIDYEKWPKALQAAYQKFKYERMSQVEAQIKSITLPYYAKNRRRPKIDDLKSLENSCIETPEQREEELRTGKSIKRSRARVSRDFAEPVIVESLTPKQAEIGILQIDKDTASRTREAVVVEGDETEHINHLIEDFSNKYRHDTSQKKEADIDIRKMIAALKTNPTGNRGVTSLADVRPYKDQNGQQHTLWRLNPAFYNGLSVSRSGKDTRIIYSLSSKGRISIVGIYSHDDYDRAIKNLH